MARFLTLLIGCTAVVALHFATAQPVATLQSAPCYEGCEEYCDTICTTNGRVCVDYYREQN